jgi:hypothetical protein
MLPNIFSRINEPLVRVKYNPIVTMFGKTVYKSTLVNGLNDKNRLTRIKNLIYFNNAKDYFSTKSSTSTTCWIEGVTGGIFCQLLYHRS